MTIKKATLVLEGGATRGIFTSGALDYLMERDLYFSDVIGVSAGSCNAVDYVSRQPGRTRDCMIPTDKEGKYYYGIRDFVKEKSLMNMDLIFDKYPKELLPFDFETYFNSEINCQIVTTNCLTGKAEYMTEDSDNDRLMKLLQSVRQVCLCLLRSLISTMFRTLTEDWRTLFRSDGHSRWKMKRSS